MRGTLREQLVRQLGFIQVTPRLSDMNDAEKAAYWELHRNDTAQQMADEANAATICQGEQGLAACHAQNLADFGDKEHEGNNTTQPKLEDIHMSNETTETTTSKATNDTRIAELEAQLAAARSPAPTDPWERIAILAATAGGDVQHIRTDIHRLAAQLAAKKTYTDHAIEVGKVAGGVALGVGLAVGIKAGVEYLFFKPIG